MRFVLVFVVLALGCAKESPVAVTPEPSVPATASTTPPAASETPPAPASSSAPVASAPIPSSMPAIDLACTVDADCGIGKYDETCCRPCKPSFGNKTSLAKIDAYCSAQKPNCPPAMPCSWASGPSKCVKGKCADPSKP